MEESTTYQAILEEGALREARKLLLMQGQKRFHRTPKAVKAAIENITDRAHLKKLLLRVWDTASWQELLALPEPARRSTQRKPKT